MPLDDDDNPTAAPAVQLQNDSGAGDEAEDEGLFDMRLFASMFNKKGVSSQAVRKGQKDFESHGTRAQENALETSRQVIEEVLSYSRVHRDTWSKGWYFPDYWPETLQAVEDGDTSGLARPEYLQEFLAETGPIYAKERVAVVEEMKGPQAKSMGRVIRGLKAPRPAVGKLWLLPEEALFLVERGSLDLWWPFRELGEILPPPESKVAEGTVHDAEQTKADSGEEADEGSDDEFDAGVPLSLQAAYALFIGMDGERGKITLPKYQVYSHLRRLGYYVQRAPPDATNLVPQPQPAGKSLWQWLVSLLDRPAPTPPPYGPLVRPGVYRQYSLIYKQLELLVRYQPTAAPQEQVAPEGAYKVHWHVWKPSKHPNLRVTDLPPPDIRIAVADARDDPVPSFEEVSALLDSTPYDPPDLNTMGGPGRLYQRLRHGYRNVLIAVVDRGLVNFMRFGQAAFGEERLYERFDNRGGFRGGKRGGRGGRGRGGRGRGRGR
ncbi:tRNA splicing endonuclease subunit [Colletotrichum higginsianum IMI 349063]|uniref:tRNA splicing endonuclease subunit n=3 Tax=Colletotrichum higginsianum TaxID=80884 RepID=A0A1B7Y2C2_COLHI|nr:tRNA splicing endonuclease subunit [Colletotrichum higginsianum IMI 349063]OBR06155.1 tRNA splicing endonuclease subunit [Colletotrichum higginsianum IMI 349063]TIC97004.1 putative tRNA-splicing endonuclease subunit tsp-5 [Colletotrichum higginsianum]GJD01603.1 tRNA splicing endonuclease subunit [Colletotrichum higginsianum]